MAIPVRSSFCISNALDWAFKACIERYYTSARQSLKIWGATRDRFQSYKRKQHTLEIILKDIIFSNHHPEATKHERVEQCLAGKRDKKSWKLLVQTLKLMKHSTLSISQKPSHDPFNKLYGKVIVQIFSWSQENY